MAQPIKLSFPGLSLEQTAKFLGVPAARARELETLVDNSLNGGSAPSQRVAPGRKGTKHASKGILKRSRAKKAR
jgi:hypothetical protein